MSRATVELDFLGIQEQSAPAPPAEKPLERRTSFKGIQNAISKLDPQVLKSVIASRSIHGGFDGRLAGGSPSDPKQESVFNQNGSVSVSTPKHLLPSSSMRFPSPIRSFNPVSSPATEKSLETAPLTIFYNGTVTVYDVPEFTAEKIMKLAENAKIGAAESAESKFGSSSEQQFLEKLNGGDLPIARKHSLHRFLEKRKERLTSPSPYASSSQKANKKLMESVGA